MADLDAWTKAARTRRNNSVLFAVPASSRPWQTGATTGYSLEAASAGALGAALAAGLIALSSAVSAGRRLLQRNKPVGDREVNDRVAILFYEDRVDVHHRQMLRTKVGDLLESHPLEAIERPDVDKLVVAGTQWTMSEDRWKELDVRLRDHDMTIREGGET